MERDTKTYLTREVLDIYLSKHKEIEYRIKVQEALKVWETMVDDYIVKHSGAVLVKDQTLFVNTDSAALANELALREHEFVEKLNTCLRKPLIKRIRFKQGHVRSRNSMGTTKERVRADLSLKTLQKIDEIVHDVREDELRDKLRKLLIAAARRNKIS